MPAPDASDEVWRHFVQTMNKVMEKKAIEEGEVAEAVELVEARTQGTVVAEMKGLVEAAADTLQEWLPGYPILVAEDGQVKVTHTYRDAVTTASGQRVIQQFMVRGNDGQERAYRIVLYISEV